MSGGIKNVNCIASKKKKRKIIQELNSNKSLANESWVKLLKRISMY